MQDVCKKLVTLIIIVIINAVGYMSDIYFFGYETG